MKFDFKKSQSWLQAATIDLPHLDRIFARSSTEILVVGAAVFQIYAHQGWIPPLKRHTGDLDLSVGLISGKKDYADIKDALLAANYKSHSSIPYRLMSPVQNPGAMTYIDLLAHPLGPDIDNSTAIKAMGAGPGFSFEGFRFASQSGFSVAPNVTCPNPFGMCALKMTAYRDAPLDRIKDLADIAELVSGLVEKGMHFEMTPLWKGLQNFAEAMAVHKILQALGNETSSQWDIETAKSELLKRNFTADEIDTLIPHRIREFVEFL